MYVRNEANVLDPIQTQLDPRVWDQPGSASPVLKPKHAHWVKRQVYSVLDQAGYTDPQQWLTLVVTGSLTTYQYSDDSDFDVSLFIDAEKFPEWSRAELIGLMVGQLDDHMLPGTPFPLQVYVVPHGVKPHDLYKPGLRSGYDLDTNRWIVPPEKDRSHDTQSEMNGFYTYALQQADKMERLLRYEPDKAVDFYHSIHERRKRDQEKGKGDFAESNLVYKFLAQRKLLPQIAAKTGSTMYHVAPAEERRNIEQHGIDFNRRDQSYDWRTEQDPREYPEGNYLTSDLDAARGYQSEGNRDIWQINAGGPMWVDPDEQWHDHGEETPEEFTHSPPYAHFTTDPIPPHRIKRIAKTSTYPMGNKDYWHVSPRENREKILEQGLQGQREDLHGDSPWQYTWPQPAGNYMFDDLDNARAYVHGLHQQVSPPPKVRDWISDPTPIQPDYEEERYEELQHPENWEDMNEEEQDHWYDQNSYKERTEDPKGYDIWNVKGHGLPVFPDPEPHVTEGGNKEHWDLGKLHDTLEIADTAIDSWGGFPEAPALNQRERENELGSEHGVTQQRLVSPTHIPPHRLKVEEHYPRWDLTPAGHEEANDETYENSYPEPWAKIPFTEVPWPGHESKHGGIARDAELVPTEVLAPYREFHRRPGEEHSFAWPGYYEALKNHIAQHGFEDPITLEYNPDKGAAIIGEGNHRLNVAEDLGLSHVPVHIMRTYSERPQVPLESQIKPDKYGCFPGNPRPSELGLPVAGPYEPANSDWYGEHPQFFSKVADLDPWQSGLCETYAQAFLEKHPEMRLGIAGHSEKEGGWTPQHFFAHDATHAYDSLGKHPLPYYGINNQFDVAELDHAPKDWLEPMEEYLPAAHEHADRLGHDSKIASSLHNLIDEVLRGTMQGGITVNLAGEPPSNRYGFAPDKSTEERVPLKELTPHHIEQYIQNHLKELSQPDKYLGTWIKDGDVWFDITEGHDDYTDAFQMAWKGHQQAMYDNVNDEVIPVRGLSYYPPVKEEKNVGLEDHSYPG